jgi:ribosome-associated translation inhibitor RaiA
VREKAAKLDRFSDHITSCRVMIEAPHRRHWQGTLFHVRLDLTLPGGELAVRDAFDAAARQIEDHVRRQRGDVKAHVGPG